MFETSVYGYDNAVIDTANAVIDELKLDLFLSHGEDETVEDFNWRQGYNFAVEIFNDKAKEFMDDTK